MTTTEVVDGDLAIRSAVVGPLATNCWIPYAVDTGEALVIDPGADPGAVLAACDGLTVRAIVLTHTHWDHVLAVPDVVAALGVAVLAHPAEAPVWPHELEHLGAHGHWDAGSSPVRVAPAAGDPVWDGRTDALDDGTRLDVGDHAAVVTHTPGHTPGGLTIVIGGHVFTGDTLFPGGPGLTGPPHSDFPTIIRSVARILDAHPDSATIHPGHGPDTTVGVERLQLEHWRRRGW